MNSEALNMYFCESFRGYRKEDVNEYIMQMNLKFSNREKEYKDKLEQLKKDLNYKTSKIKELEEKQKDMSLNLTTSYASYIGTENLNVRKIDAMIGAIESGQAKNISEAIAVVNQTK